MSKLGRKQIRERIETYLAEHPGATSAEIGKFLGVSKQRAHQLLTLLRGADATLTERELKILHYIAGGSTNREIGQALSFGEQSIKNEISAILAKLNAKNRTHAVTIAMQQGLISLDELKPAKTSSK